MPEFPLYDPLSAESLNVRPSCSQKIHERSPVSLVIDVLFWLPGFSVKAGVHVKAVFRTSLKIASSRRSVSQGAVQKTARDNIKARREEASSRRAFIFSRAVFCAAPY